MRRGKAPHRLSASPAMGSMAAAILDAVKTKEGTATDIAAALSLPPRDIALRLSHLVALGRVDVARRVRFPEVRRAVAVYGVQAAPGK